NTDHTLMQGVELINRLLLGEAEQTIGIKYESTLDGRNAAHHERSTLAGSGCPKPKGSPDEAPVAKKHPGQGQPATAATAAAAKPTVLERPKPASLNRDGGPGDKEEVHVSEEELGVTTPRRKS